MRKASPGGGFSLPPASAWWEGEERREALEVLRSVWRASSQTGVDAACKKLKSDILDKHMAAFEEWVAEEEARQQQQQVIGQSSAGQKRKAPEGGRGMMQQNDREKLLRGVDALNKKIAAVKQLCAAYGLSCVSDEACMLSVNFPDGAE